MTEAEASARTADKALVPLPVHRARVLATLAQILLRQGRAAEARAVGDETLQLLDTCGGIGVGDIATRVVAAEAHLADCDEEGARAILQEALQRLRQGTHEIPDLDLRTRFLQSLPENVRANELAATLNLERVVA